MIEEYVEESHHVVDNPYEFPVYYFAGFWIRFFAFLVDLICISAISRIVINILSVGYPLSGEVGILSGASAVKLVVYLGYFILMTKLNRGQTIGKMIFGLQVISLDDIQLTWVTVFVREGACRFILKTPLLGLGYIVAAFTHRKQHIGDLFSQTSVISLNVVKASKNGK